MERKLVFVNIAAKYYEVSVWTIRRWISEDRIYGEKDRGGRRWKVDINSKKKGAEDMESDAKITPKGRRIISSGVCV